MITRNTHTSGAGFTLVELAIALMIIGLLIGGVLKGEELVANTRALSVARQFKEFTTAEAAFYSTYNAMPGDIRSPGTRIPGCTTTPCTTAGDDDEYITIGNNRYGNTLYTSAPANVEYRNYWLHMAKAGLITAINPDYTDNPSYPWTAGTDFPTSNMGGSWHVRSSAYDGALPAPYNAMTYYWLGQGDIQTVAGHVGSSTTHIMTPLQAYQIDQKIDDGNAYSGTLRNPNTGSGCANATTGVYVQTEKSTKYCTLFFITSLE